MTTPLPKDSGISNAQKNAQSLDELTSRFDDLIAKMQTSEAQAGALAAFNATPEELGEFAVRAAMREKAEKKG